MGESVESVLFMVSGGHVVHDTIDGEVVVVNLGTGNYYSLQGPSAEAWSALVTPTKAVDLAPMLGRRLSISDDAALTAAVALVSYLCAEGVISPEVEVAVDATALDALPSEVRDGLQVERFTDVQELLTIDPVHDVDERGWPSQAVDSAS